MVEVKIKSGSFTGLPKKLQTLVHDLMHDAVIQGTESALDSYESGIAKRSGRLRRSFRNMFTTQVSSLEGKSRIVITFQKLPTPSYSKYHIYGSHGEALSNSPYKHAASYLRYSSRTVTGTKPIDEQIFMGILFREIKKTLSLLFSSEGLNYTDYTGVAA